mgnify:CR=1 FL=1
MIMDYAEIAFWAGRVLYGGFFVLSGVNHFAKNRAMASYAASKGVPMARLAVYGSGLLLLFGGLGVLLWAYIPWAVLALVIFLVVVSFKMHAFWSMQDPNMKMADMTNFLKNMALLGGALLLLSISPAGGYLPY